MGPYPDQRLMPGKYELCKVNERLAYEYAVRRLLWLPRQVYTYTFGRFGWPRLIVIKLISLHAEPYGSVKFYIEPFRKGGVH